MLRLFKEGGGERLEGSLTVAEAEIADSSRIARSVVRLSVPLSEDKNSSGASYAYVYPA